MDSIIYLCIYIYIYIILQVCKKLYVLYTLSIIHMHRLCQVCLSPPGQYHLFIQQPHEANVGASSTVKEKGLLQEALLSTQWIDEITALRVGDDYPLVN